MARVAIKKETRILSSQFSVLFIQHDIQKIMMDITGDLHARI